MTNETTPEMSATVKSAMLLAICFNLIADAPYSVKRHAEIEQSLAFLKELHNQAMSAVEAENAAMIAAEAAAEPTSTEVVAKPKKTRKAKAAVSNE
jgi:hypothetical protein